MTHAAITAAFFAKIPAQVRDLILSNIAAHYGITTASALAEVTHDEAESLLDYITGPERIATLALMRKVGINPFPVEA